MMKCVAMETAGITTYSRFWFMWRLVEQVALVIVLNLNRIVLVAILSWHYSVTFWHFEKSSHDTNTDTDTSTPQRQCRKLVLQYCEAGGRWLPNSLVVLSLDHAAVIM